MTRTIWTAASALALFAAGQAAAMQDDASAPASASADTASVEPSGEKMPDGTTAEERANTARLNAEQASRAKAENTAYEQQVQAVAQEEAAAQENFAQETAAYEAEKARVAAMSAEERLQWEADVAACKAGDTTRCAQPVPPATPNP